MYCMEILFSNISSDSAFSIVYIQLYVWNSTCQGFLAWPRSAVIWIVWFFQSFQIFFYLRTYRCSIRKGIFKCLVFLLKVNREINQEKQSS